MWTADGPVKCSAMAYPAAAVQTCTPSPHVAGRGVKQGILQRCHCRVGRLFGHDPGEESTRPCPTPPLPPNPPPLPVSQSQLASAQGNGLPVVGIGVGSQAGLLVGCIQHRLPPHEAHLPGSALRVRSPSHRSCPSCFACKACATCVCCASRASLWSACHS